MSTKQSSQIFPIRRRTQVTRKNASELDSVKMCEINKEKRTLKFYDSKIFIEVCRYLDENFGLEFYREEDRDF